MIHRLTIDAFHATPMGRQAVVELAEDPLFARSRVTILDGGLAGAVAHYQGNPSPQLVVVEEIDDDKTMLAHLAQLSEVCVAGTRVVVIGQLNDIGLYRQLLSQGVSEYLIAPITGRQLAAAIQQLFAEPGAAPRGRLMAFFGARGGVGSSSLAHACAWALARQTGERVVVVDLDLAFGTLGLAFDSEARQTLGDLLAEPGRMDLQVLERILIKYDDHLDLLPASAELRPWPVIEVEAVDRLMDLTRQMAPFVVFDLPHLWAPWLAHALEVADELVVVATPDLAGLRDAKGVLDRVKSRRGEAAPARLVLNKVESGRRNALSPRDFAEAVKVSPTLTLPADPAFAEACNNGQPLGEKAGSGKVAEAVAGLAMTLAGRAARPAPAKPLAGWLRKTRLVK